MVKTIPALFGWSYIRNFVAGAEGRKSYGGQMAASTQMFLAGVDKQCCDQSMWDQDTCEWTGGNLRSNVLATTKLARIRFWGQELPGMRDMGTDRLHAPCLLSWQRNPDYWEK